MGRVQPRPAWSLAQPSDHGVNYFRNCMKNAMAGGEFKEENEEESLPGQKRKVVGDVPGGAWKTDVWLVAAMTMKMR